MTPSDTEKTVREAAEYFAFMNEGDGYDDHNISRFINHAHVIARAYLRLTDPTPLTVEKLVEMEFTAMAMSKEDGPYRKGNLMVAFGGDGSVSAADISRHLRSIYPAPRTVGELNMLLKLMEAKP